MLNSVRNWLLTTTVLFCAQTSGANLLDIQVFNGENQARIAFSFVGDPEYAFSQLDKHSVALDVKQIGMIRGLPLQFIGNNLIKSIHLGTPRNAQTLRLVAHLTKNSKTCAVKQKNGPTSYTVVFIINTVSPPQAILQVVTPSVGKNNLKPHHITPAISQFKNQSLTSVISSNNATSSAVRFRTTSSDRIAIAIDAGHGGQDPGAIGPGGTHEKNVTIAIARKLRTLLNKDPTFKGVMTRDDDYFIPVMGRSDVARKQNANLLVSIHADAAPNHHATGASVWVLSNNRANSEMANWLEAHEKQYEMSKLLDGTGDVLANSQVDDPYLSQVLLDLQFGYSQQVGYDVATQVLSQLASVSSLHKHCPEHASLGVLRAPDIPSILVETGFISNTAEERLLASTHYQQQIAEAIYKGLRHYFEAHRSPRCNAALVRPPNSTAISGKGAETN